ncbi:hypothetical protein [Streptomyces buecherae]|uniref:hypothetical protein n=1 Tax=Streptomyces buecherae TaxID=2763006 RepID=UPI0036A5C0A7
MLAEGLHFGRTAAGPDLARGPVVLRVPRMLAVAADHPLAGREAVSVEDLAQDRVFARTGDVPAYWQEHLAPSLTPSGQPVRRGRSARPGGVATPAGPFGLPRPPGPSRQTVPRPAGSRDHFAQNSASTTSL